MERKTHTLLEKFVRNSITSQEGKELKDSVAKMSDEELTQTLSDVWENYGTSVTVPDGVSHFMKKLSPAAHSHQPHFLYTFLKVAAAVIIPVLLGTQIYFYYNNEKLNSLLNSQLTVQVESGDKMELILPDGTKVYLNAPLSFTVKGILLDSLTQEGEPYATIRITKKSAPNKAVKMAVTGANGHFQEKLNVASGEYVITISSIGKSPIVKEFALKPSVRVVDLGTLYSSEVNNVLKGVEIVAQKPLVKVDVDKIEYNIEDDPDSKSNSILEMLRKVPLVTVDGEDNVQVNGSSSFKIHVNGKPNNMMSNNPKEVLKSMPANTIKYIEVITSPGAKYDAEGIGGILNIVTVGSGFEGYTATFRGNANNNGVGAGSYAMIKQGKLTLSANYNYNYNNSPRSYSDSYRENYESVDEKYLESESSSKSKGNFQYGNLEASYEIDTLRLLTMAFGMYGGGSKNNSDGSTIMYGSDHQSFAYRYNTDNHGKGSWYSINGNVDYQRTSKKNKERMITFSYKINSQPQTNDSYNTYLNIEPEADRQDIIDNLLLKNFHSDGKTNTMEQTFQVDFTTPIGKLHTIETGAKYIDRKSTRLNSSHTQKSRMPSSA